MTVETSDIQITKVGEEPGSASLRVEIAAERVNAAEKKATASYARRAKLPGFRKGKVPHNVVRRQFREQIRQSVLQELIAESWKAAIDQESLEPIADPRVKDLKFEDGSPISFELQVDVKPEITLDRIGGFSFTRKQAGVTDEMVDAQLKDLRRRQAPWIPVEEGVPRLGHMVSVSIATIQTDDSGEATERDEEKQYQIVLGEGQAIPDLEEQILRLEPGQTTRASVRYPEDFPDEAKRGQPRTVQITLHEIKRLDLPELDDQFAGTVGDFDSLDALRSTIREDLEAQARRDADEELRRQVIDQVITANNLEAPRPLVHRVLSGYAQAYEVPDDRLDQFAQEFQPIAERQVQRDLIIDHLAKREGLTATEEDLDKRIAEIAERRKAEPREVYASLQKANRLREIEHSLTEEKVFEFLIEQSTVTEERTER